MFASLEAKLITLGLCVILAFSGGFGLEWHLRNGDDAIAQVRRDAAEIRALQWQSDLSQKSGASAQAITDKYTRDVAVNLQREDDASHALMSRINNYVPQHLTVCPKPKPEVNNVSPTQPVPDSLPWGIVRFHDAAATGTADPTQLPIAPGELNATASGIEVPQFTALLADNYKSCRENAGQLSGLQGYVGEVKQWADDLFLKLSKGR